MKKKLFSCILLAVFACVALFSFAACNSDQNVSDRLDALESDMDALETRMEALEAANANFQQQLAALDTSSDTFADDLAELTSNYNSLTASVQNATHIERVVVTKNELSTQSIIENVYLTLTCTDNVAVIGCSIEYLNYPPLFQLVTCITQITINTLSDARYILCLVVLFFYFPFSESRTGSTIGKGMMHIKVTKLDGEIQGVIASFIRQLILVLDIFTLGFLASFVTPKKQTIKDILTRTVVIDR